MIPLVRGESPLWHTYHRAWSACVGLPKYDKTAWRRLDDSVIRAEKSGNPWAIAAVLQKIEALLLEQGGVYMPEPGLSS